MSVTIDRLHDGIRQINQVYIENPEFDPDHYTTMIVHYFISAFLLDMGGTAEDFGLYENPRQVGYVGWISLGEATLFFGPTKAVILSGSERSKLLDEDEPLSPIGSI